MDRRPHPKAVNFFRRNAGYVRRSGESVATAKRRGALALARAEAEAAARGWRVEWEGDPEPYEDEDAREVLGAVLRDLDGHVLASLWGIADPTREYQRVVEAELALEALEEKR